MSKEEIPEDILASAREYADEYAGDEWHYANRVGCLARAIMAERARSAAQVLSYHLMRVVPSESAVTPGYLRDHFEVELSHNIRNGILGA
jgi:hypothetical protein